MLWAWTVAYALITAMAQGQYVGSLYVPSAGESGSSWQTGVTANFSRIAESDGINIRGAPFNAVCDGTTDDSNALALAIAALPVVNGLRSGRIVIPGRCAFTSLDLTATGPLGGSGNSVTFEGLAGIPGQNVQSQLIYSGNTGGPGIRIDKTNAVTFRDLRITVFSGLFSGRLIDAHATASPYVQFLEMERCRVDVPNSTATSLVWVQGAIGFRFYRCYFSGADVQIEGITDSAGINFSNNGLLDECYHTGYGTAAVKNAGQNWEIRHPIVEPAASGAVTLYTQSAVTGIATIGNGLMVKAAGRYDVAAGSSYITWGANDGGVGSFGLTVLGGIYSFMAGAATSLVTINGNNCQGIMVMGTRHFGGITGSAIIDFGTTTGHSNVVIMGNGSSSGGFAGGGSVVKGTIPTSILYQEFDGTVHGDFIYKPWTALNSTLLGWSVDIATGVQANTALPAAATLYLCRVPLPDAISVTSIRLLLGTLGSNLTHSYVALYRSDGTIVGQSADQSADWGTAGATGAKSIALVGGPFAVSPLQRNDFVWVAIYVGTASAALPAFGRAGSTATLVNAGGAPGTWRFGSVAQADTATLANITPASTVAAANAYIVGIS